MVRIAVAPLLLALALASAPAAADSQSSNSSSNCSNGHCARMDSYSEQRGRHHRGWTRYHEWREPSRDGRFRGPRGRDDDDD